MKKALLILLMLITIQPAVICAPKKMLPVPSDGGEQLPNIFIYKIPDDTFKIEDEKTLDEQVLVEEQKIEEVSEDEIISLEDEPVLGATVLKGYAQYIDDSNTITLKDENNEYVLNIKNPQKISATKGLNLKRTNKPTLKYVDAEYLIAPNTISTSSKVGNFTVGAKFNNEIDNIAMLETETGLFTRYERNKFALSSSVTKSLNTTYAQDYNTLSFSPELKINKHLKLKNIFSADVTRNRQAYKFVLSINPFKDTDRFLLELGAKQTYYAETEQTTSQFSFSTEFKL
jgi:hypothetical protein